MKSTVDSALARLPAAVQRRGFGKTDRFAQQAVHRLLNQLSGVQIGVHDQRSGLQWFGDTNAETRAEIWVNDVRFYRFVAFGGSVGAGESYMLGDWDTPDLTAVLRIFARNRELLDAMDQGWAKLAQPVMRWLHARNRNTLAGSERNIAAHYDLGNDFFARFLDESMMYSSAIYADANDSLEQAQLSKLDHICAQLDLQPGDELLEIGTGWGGLAIHAAQHYGCQVTTTTISQRQYEYAAARIQRLGLDKRVTLLKQDYRELSGQYDKLVSIEMIEAVGHQYLGNFFDRCDALLKDDGCMLLQAITIEDHRYQAALRNVDFIKKYIFPGCFIPSLAALHEGMARHSSLRTQSLQDIGPSYALTLRAWRERFEVAKDELLAEGLPEEFIKRWRFYFAYCEAGFAERALGDVQMVLGKPGARLPQRLIELRPSGPQHV